MLCAEELIENAKHNLGTAKRLRDWTFVDIAIEQLESAIKVLEEDGD